MALLCEIEMDAVALAVGDLDRSLDYYRRTIGLELLQRDNGQAVLGVPERPLLELEARPRGLGARHVDHHRADAGPQVAEHRGERREVAALRRSERLPGTRERLVRINMPVARDVAHRYEGRGVDADDLRQVAYLGAFRGFVRFGKYGDAAAMLAKLSPNRDVRSREHAVLSRLRRVPHAAIALRVARDFVDRRLARP